MQLSCSRLADDMHAGSRKQRTLFASLVLLVVAATTFFPSVASAAPDIPPSKHCAITAHPFSSRDAATHMVAELTANQATISGYRERLATGGVLLSGKGAPEVIDPKAQKYWVITASSTLTFAGAVTATVTRNGKTSLLPRTWEQFGDGYAVAVFDPVTFPKGGKATLEVDTWQCAAQLDIRTTPDNRLAPLWTVLGFLLTTASVVALLYVLRADLITKRHVVIAALTAAGASTGLVTLAQQIPSIALSGPTIIAIIIVPALAAASWLVYKHHHISTAMNG